MHKMRGGASAPPLLFVESAFTGRDLARQLSRRCLIPADGFYEWQTPAEPKARKQPWYISPTDAPFFAFAGLMERRGPREDPLYTACIVTTDANELMEPIHDRMPVILAPEAWSSWLDPGTPTWEVKSLLRPAPAEGMRAWPVSRDVSNARSEGPRLIEAV